MDTAELSNSTTNSRRIGPISRLTEGGTFHRATTPPEVDAGIIPPASITAEAVVGATMPGLAEPEPAEVVDAVQPHTEVAAVAVAAVAVAAVVEAAVAVADAVVDDPVE